MVFFTLCLAALTSLTTVDLLTNERSLVVRETQAQMYRPVTYYLAKGEEPDVAVTCCDRPGCSSVSGTVEEKPISMLCWAAIGMPSVAAGGSSEVLTS